MKILFLTDSFPPLNMGGAGSVAHDMAMELLKKGNQVFVLTTVQNRFKQGEYNDGGLNVFRIYSRYHER